MMSRLDSLEEELPVVFWGLDPVFCGFAKLYIRDILELKPSQRLSGIFVYNGHPIRRVDILGIVVSKREREKFYSYGVDDGTGVINCTCWKKMDTSEKPSYDAGSHQSTVGGLNIDEMLKKLQDTEKQNTNLEIGDVITVRGVIKVYREQREIVSSVYHKLDDPMCEAQIYRMLHVPNLYKYMYDVPFEIPRDYDGKSQIATSLTCELTEKVEEFLANDKIQNFYPRELETIKSLMSLITARWSDPQGSKSGPSAKEIRSLFKDAIAMLQENGVVFLKSQISEVYLVTDQDKELHKTTLHIIQADCKRHRHAEKGCHFLHILNCVRLHYSPNVNDAVVQRVLNTLESDSQIVSTMEKYYTAF